MTWILFSVRCDMSNAVENEFKFTTDRHIDAMAVIDRLESFLRDHDVTYTKKNRSSVDTYFDSKDLELFNSGCSLRNKVSSNGKIKLTAKKPISSNKGVMSRKEIEKPSDGSLRSVKSFGAQIFPNIVIRDEPSLTLESERTAFYYEDEGNEIMLSFDKCRYISGRLSKEFLEIEIELMGDNEEKDFDHIGLERFITEDLSFKSVTKSKYQRGIDW